jgi:hypothetical protein
MAAIGAIFSPKVVFGKAGDLMMKMYENDGCDDCIIVITLTYLGRCISENLNLELGKL